MEECEPGTLTVHTIGVDPGVRNLGIAHATFQVPRSHTAAPASLVCTRMESKRVDFLSESMWAHGASFQRDMEASRERTLRFASRTAPPPSCPDPTRPQDGAPLPREDTPSPPTGPPQAPKPSAKGRSTRKRKRSAAAVPRSWRRWRAKPPRSARLVTGREIVQLVTAATRTLVPTCAAPTIVYIESQPAGRASNAKIGSIGMALYTAIRTRMASGTEPILACELIPPARKYSATEIYEPLGIARCPSRSGTNGIAGYRVRKSESCRIAEALCARVVADRADATEPPATTRTPKGAKLDDEADAVILAYLAARDARACILARAHASEMPKNM